MSDNEGEIDAAQFEAEAAANRANPLLDPADPPEPTAKAPQVEAEPVEVDNERPGPRNKLQGKRNRMYEAAKRARRGEATDDGVDPETFPAMRPVEGDLEIQLYQQPKKDEPVAEEPAEEPVEPEAAPAPQSRKLKLKVDGKEVELDEDEVLRRAQRDLAADNRLEDVKELRRMMAEERAQFQNELAELRKLRQNGGVGEDHAGQDTPVSSPTQSERRDQALDDVRKQRFREAAHRLQLGDEEEGAEALASLFAESTARQPERSPEEIAEVVIAQMERREAARKASEEFQTRFPEIAQDEGLVLLTSQEVGRRAADELRRLADDGVIDMTPAQRAQLGNPMTAIEWHKNLLNQGAPLTPPGKLAFDAAETVKTRYVRPAEAPAQQTALQTRIEEKRTNLAPQPRRASIPAPANAQPMTAEEKRRLAVRQMRAQRGQKVVV